MDNLEITSEDIQKMLQVNPVAAEQVKVIALQRALALQTAELEMFRSDKVAGMEKQVGDESD